MEDVNTARDRDERGRPLNARPRDALGRPLPPGSPGVQRLPEDLDLAPDDALTLAQQLIDDGRAFYAHEVFESLWKSCAAERRPLWQGLAQLAVGVTHLQRGNRAGAVSLLRRAATQLSQGGEPPHGIDVSGLIGFADALAADVDAGVDIDPHRLRPRLRSA
ncbi:DUF309 domain-containing protein [Mycolicibacterium brumae]|uniref:DUF309 domain-containing protein n=1 Tax=Mycolicibacterium brumae TaxID=85968 RepID=A0A2G5PG05_9MYCO|nr:DUF309 domain-containing protein [Mycolicibacterium brumae]MCV7192074.1 DUF309 domain-containing protein [Mycolicibacterium brumae]PIB76963.1 DUF309 domain-containing protein [Mycolicibacterium brumae]UWW07838.1 DUF309 domain-containing protein [Mycolicibacterium brumae]